jgi:hypothetical protein
MLNIFLSLEFLAPEKVINAITFSQGKLEVWEEQIGVRLALRLIDTVG